jgi:hypothetical protein
LEPLVCLDEERWSATRFGVDLHAKCHWSTKPRVAAKKYVTVRHLAGYGGL